MTSTWQAFRRDTRGSVAVIVAFAALILVLIAGAAIDMGRLFYVRSALQSSLDAAALAAGRSSYDSTKSKEVVEAQLTKVAQGVLNANVQLSPTLVTVGPVRVSYTPPTGLAPDSMRLTLSADMPTAFLQVFGTRNIHIDLATGLQPPQPGPIDLALVLDVTSSMGDPPKGGGEAKIATLQAAATALVDQIMTANIRTVQIGVVPYSSYVNVGLRNEDWIFPLEAIDKGACTSWTYENPEGKCKNIGYFDCVKDGFLVPNGCLRTDCSAKGNQICLNRADKIYRWNGCLGARSVLTNNPLNMKLNESTDAFLGTIDRPTNPPYSGTPSKFLGSGDCPRAQILQMTDNKSQVLSRIRSLTTGGNTHIPTGLLWGWNILAPEVPYIARTQATLDRLGGRKVMLLMTDGVNTMSPRLYDGTYQINKNATLTPEWRDGKKSNALISQLCESIKGQKIAIYTVLFDVEQGSEIDGILTNCASSPGMAFRASDRQGLLKAFNEIGNQLKYLKLTQ